VSRRPARTAAAAARARGRRPLSRRRTVSSGSRPATSAGSTGARSCSAPGEGHDPAPGREHLSRLYEPSLHVPGVELAVIVGVPAADGDERVVAVVQAAAGAAETAVRAALRTPLARMGAARPDAVIFARIPLAGRSRKPDRAAAARWPPGEALAVIVPAYNEQRLLPGLLRALAAQSDPEFTLVLVDNAPPTAPPRSPAPARSTCTWSPSPSRARAPPPTPASATPSTAARRCWPGRTPTACPNRLGGHRPRPARHRRTGLRPQHPPPRRRPSLAERYAYPPPSASPPSTAGGAGPPRPGVPHALRAGARHNLAITADLYLRCGGRRASRSPTDRRTSRCSTAAAATPTGSSAPRTWSSRPACAACAPGERAAPCSGTGTGVTGPQRNRSTSVSRARTPTARLPAQPPDPVRPAGRDRHRPALRVGRTVLVHDRERI